MAAKASRLRSISCVVAVICTLAHSHTHTHAVEQCRELPRISRAQQRVAAAAASRGWKLPSMTHSLVTADADAARDSSAAPQFSSESADAYILTHTPMRAPTHTLTHADTRADGRDQEEPGTLEVRARTCNGVMYAQHRLADLLYTCAAASVPDCIRTHTHASVQVLDGPRGGHTWVEGGHADAEVATVTQDDTGAGAGGAPTCVGRPAGTAVRITIADAPTFSMRYYSDQGQMLDMPDRGYYYSITPPPGATGIPALVNESRVREDAQTLLGLVPVWQSLGLNALIWESDSLEEYVNYDFLSQKVYDQSDLHRNRTEAFGRLLRNFTSSMHAEGMKIYSMLFDLTFPPQLAQLYNISSVYSPDLLTVLTARFKELFARLPELDGLLVYVCDSWFPRAGYNFSIIWNGPYEMAALATTYYNAMQAATNGTKELIFSMWIPVSPLDSWGIFRNNTPPNITLLINDGQGDFLYDHDMNTILADGGGRDRRMLVAFDAFRQYDGWGRVVSFPGEEWVERTQYAANTSVAGISIFGEWSPSNSWPDSLSYPESGELLNWTMAKGYKSWIGHWNRYRIFQLKDYGLFSPNEGNVYVLSQLAWNPYQDPLSILTSWAQMPPLSLNAEAAPYIAAAYNLSADAWMAKYLPGVDEYAQEWSGVFTPKTAPNPESAGFGLLSLYANATLPQLITANARIAESLSTVVSLVQTALAMNGSSVPQHKLSNAEVAATGDVGAGLLLAAQKTQDYVATFAEFRITVWLNYTLGVTSDPALQKAYCGELSQHVIALSTAVSTFGQLYPEESTAWNVAAPNPVLDVRPYFFRLEQRSMTDWLPEFQQTLTALCGRALE